MQLYTTSASPNGQRVNVFLKEKGIEVPTTEIDLRGAENLSDDFRARNPFGRVPVLELDDGSHLAESVAICRYFEGLHPEPNLFGAPGLEAAQIEMWMRRVELNYLQPVAQAFRNSTGFFKDREECSAEWGRIATGNARAAAELFNEQLAERAFFLGERYSIADLTFAIAVTFAKNVGQDHTDLPNIERHRAAVTARPAFA